MESEHKVGAIVAVCVASVICTVVVCITWYYHSIATKAMESGLVQEVIGNQVIWTKPKDK